MATYNPMAIERAIARYRARTEELAAMAQLCDLLTEKGFKRMRHIGQSRARLSRYLADHGIEAVAVRFQIYSYKS